MAYVQVHEGEAKVIPLPSHSNDRQEVVKTFLSSWTKGTSPKESDIKQVYSINNKSLEKNFQQYCRTRSTSNIGQFYHGTVVKCSLQTTGTLCFNESCGICGIVRQGFSPERRGMHVIWFRRFGLAYYLAPNSSKCHEYSEGYGSCRALLCCSVAQGKTYMAETNMQKLVAPPPGYDSVYGQPGIHRARGGSLNYAEVAVYDNNAILPVSIVFYEKDGINLKL